jgi:hypothetical protein
LSEFPKKLETKVKRYKKRHNWILKTSRSLLKRKRTKFFSKEKTHPKIFNFKKKASKNQRKRKLQRPRRIRKPQKMKTNKILQSSIFFPKINRLKTIVIQVILQLIKAQVLSCGIIEGSNTIFKFSSMII